MSSVTLRDWFIEALKGNRAIQDAWDASHPDHPQLSTMRRILDEIRDEKEQKVTEVKQTVFDESEVRAISILKNEAITLMKQARIPDVHKNYIVIAGGCFASWFLGDTPKDYDFFLIGNEIAQDNIMQELVAASHGTISDTTEEYVRDNPNIRAVYLNRVRKFQYILTKYNTREELLAGFDLAHTQVSFHNDKLYINRRTFDSIKHKKLVANERPVEQWRLNKFVQRNWSLADFDVRKNEQLLAAKRNNISVSTAVGGGGSHMMKINHPLSGARVNPIRSIPQDPEDLNRLMDELAKNPF